MRQLVIRLRRLSRFGSRIKTRASTRFGLLLNLAGFKMKLIFNIVVGAVFVGATILSVLAIVRFIDEWVVALTGAF